MSRVLLRLAAVLPFSVTFIAALPTAAATTSCVDYGAGAQFVDYFALTSSGDAGLSVHAVGVNRLISETSSQLRSFDISDRSHPVVEQTQGFWAGRNDAMAMLGDNWLYTADGDTLVTVDFTTPSQPVVTSMIGTPLYTLEIVVDAAYAYLATWPALTVLDLSTPSAPTIAASVALPDTARGVAASAPFAYAATHSGIFVVKAQPPSTAHVVPPTIPISADDIVVSGSYAYAIHRSAGFTVLDITTPNAPVVVASLPGVTGYKLWGTPDAIYTSTPFRRIDISDPLAPIAGVDIRMAFRDDISVVDDHAYFQLGYGPSYNPAAVLDMTAYPEPVPFLGKSGQFAEHDAPIATFGSHAFTIEAFLNPVNSYYLRAVDLTDPASPLLVPLPFPVLSEHYHNLGSTNGVATDASAPTSAYVFETTGSMLNTWDISDPGDLSIVAQFPITAGTEDFAVESGLAFCSGLSGLQIVDVSSPLSAVARGTINPHAADHIAVSGSRAYLMDGATGDYSIVDATNPDVPGLLFGGNFGFAATGMTVEGSFLYVVSDALQRLYVFDVSDPAVPSLAGSAPVPFKMAVNHVDVGGPTAYVSSPDYGLLAFDVSVPASPTYVGGQWTTTSAWHALATDDFVLFLSGTGLVVAPLHGTTTTVSAPAPQGAPGLVLLPPAPNPFRDRTSIAFRMATAGTADVRVYSASGRLVRVLREGQVGAGSHVAFWDGRDDQGRPVGSGIYFARVESSSAGTSAQKIVRVR